MALGNARTYVRMHVRTWHSGGSGVALGWLSGGSAVPLGWHSGGTRVVLGWRSGGSSARTYLLIRCGSQVPVQKGGNKALFDAARAQAPGVVRERQAWPGGTGSLARLRALPRLLL